ncbi:MAG: tetratricopeptide repeat protein [Acidobacteriota bacterium]|nr:MAG: tetratricopeptide repeat protein [Acidobacteriota bacterium]
MKKISNRFGATMMAMIGVLAMSGSMECQTKPAQREDSVRQAALAFEAGQNAHQAGNLEEAIRLYGRALEMDPGLWQAEFQRGAAYRSLGRLSEARVSITRVLGLLKEYADSAELRGIRARVQMMLGDIEAAGGRAGEAEAAYRQVLDLDSGNAGAHAALAEIYHSGGKHDQAITEAQAAIKAGEDGALIFTLLGEAQVAGEKFDEALASYDEALKRDPAGSRALHDRARLRLRLGRTDEAIEDLRKLVSIAPEPSIRLLLAGALGGVKRYDEAIELYRQILKADASNLEARTGLAALLIESGREKEAIAELETLVASEPRRADLRAQLGELYQAGDPAKALSHYSAAAQIEPDQPAYLIGAGTALVRLKRYQEAIGALQRAMALKPDARVEYFIHTNLATALFEMDDFANAAREFIWILGRQQEEGNRKRAAISLYFLGICFDKLGDYEQALKAYENFLSLATPENQLEVEKIKLRLPSLQRQIKEGKGKRKG